MVHNKHNDAPFGCRNTKTIGSKTLTPSTSIKNKNLQPDSDQESSSDSSESEEGSISRLEAIEDVSRSSSSYENSDSSDDEEESDASVQNRKNIILNHIDEVRSSDSDLSASFHDSSSYESSDDDFQMPDLFSDSDESDEEHAIVPNLDNNNQAMWTQFLLTKIISGKFQPGQRPLPPFTHPYPPGPANIPPATSFPIDYFHLYLDTEIMDVFVVNTNLVVAKLFASKKKGSNGSHMGRWKPTCLSELYRLFGVLLHMGIKRQPTMRSYWSQDPRYSDAFVKKCFSRDRFIMLKSALHLVNPNEFTIREQKIKQQEDPFWRVTPFLEHLSLCFRRHFIPYQNIDIDEMCIGFKGRHVARCYNPNKPEKWHLKAFCLNDSKTGYLHHFYMYQGMFLFFF